MLLFIPSFHFNITICGIYSLFTIGGICCERLVYVDAIKRTKDKDDIERSTSMSQSVGLGSLFDLNYLYFTKNCCNIIVFDFIFDSNDLIKYGFMDKNEISNIFGNILSSYVLEENNVYIPPNINKDISNSNPIHKEYTDENFISEPIVNSNDINICLVNEVGNISDITDSFFSKNDTSELDSIDLSSNVINENDSKQNEKSIIDGNIDSVKLIEPLPLTKNEIVKKDAIYLFKRYKI
jgi:hypothetical protein